MRVTVIDYKAGNLTSVLKALRHLGAEVEVTDSDLSLIERADRLILPGVGHFSATKRLDDSGITAAVRASIARGAPFLGICVGMQWLMEGSEEAPEQPGLGHFRGHCRRFPAGAEKIPHVGWNHILPRTQPATRLLAGVQPSGGGEYAYFTHSYYVPFECLAPRPIPPNGHNFSAALTWYMVRFASAVEDRNVMGVQFHPEKSGATGLKILRNFLAWQPESA